MRSLMFDTLTSTNVQIFFSKRVLKRQKGGLGWGWGHKRMVEETKGWLRRQKDGLGWGDNRAGWDEETKGRVGMRRQKDGLGWEDKRGEGTKKGRKGSWIENGGMRGVGGGAGRQKKRGFRRQEGFEVNILGGKSCLLVFKTCINIQIKQIL